MFRLGTARRVILSASVPVLMVLCVHRLEFRVNERPVTADDGIMGAFATAFKGKDATVFDTFIPRDQWWFWPAIALLTTVWLWMLWGSAPRVEREA